VVGGVVAVGVVATGFGAAVTGLGGVVVAATV
jgi:hypothetical protein